MSRCHLTRVPEESDPELLLQQLKGVLKHLGAVLGQPTGAHDQLSEEEPTSEAAHPEQGADLGLIAGQDAENAQHSVEGKCHNSDNAGPAERFNGREQEQKGPAENPVSQYQRVRCVREEDGRILWRTKTTFPGHKSLAWLDFQTEAEAAQASDAALMRFAFTQPEKSTELIGVLNVPLAHYISSGTANEQTLAMALLDYLLRLPKLSVKNRQRVVDAYAALLAEREAARRGGFAAAHLDLCNVVHHGNGVAGRLAQSAVRQDSDHSSGTSDLPEGVIGPSDGQQGSYSPREAQHDTDQEQTGQQEAAPSSERDRAAPGELGPGPSIRKVGDKPSEQHAQGEGGGPSDAGVELDMQSDCNADGDVEHDASSPQQDVRSHTHEGKPCAAEPQPTGEPLSPDEMTQLERLARAAAEAVMQPQPSPSLPQDAAAEPMDEPPPPQPPPFASLLDDPPSWPQESPVPEPEQGSPMEEDGLDAALEDAAPDGPVEPQHGSEQPSTSQGQSTSSASVTSSSNDSALPGNETQGQASSSSQPPSFWGARNGHVRGGGGMGTAEDPVLLSSDTDQEEDDETQEAKRTRRETRPPPGVVKLEKAVPIKQPTLADLLQHYRDPRNSARGRPGSLHRPRMPLFESLRRPVPTVGVNGGAAHSSAQSSAGFRQAPSAWGPQNAAGPGPMSGQPSDAAQMPQHASPATPSMRARAFGSFWSQQHLRPPAAAPSSGKPFSGFRQAPARPVAKQPEAPQAPPQSGGPAAQFLHANAAGGSRPWQPWSRAPSSFEFVDLGSSSSSVGDSQGASWHRDDTTDAQSAHAHSTKCPPQPPLQPTPLDTAPAAAPQGQGSVEPPPPVVRAPKADDTSRIVIERDRAAMAAVEAEEWEVRRVEIERQAEEARREKKRRRAESELAVRSQARLEDHRRLLAAQESEADERGRLRTEIRALLEQRVRHARSAESRLRALNIPLDYDPLTSLPNVSRAVRRALRFYHPDRYQSVGLRAQVEAEEMFKLVSRVQNP